MKLEIEISDDFIRDNDIKTITVDRTGLINFYPQYFQDPKVVNRFQWSDGLGNWCKSIVENFEQHIFDIEYEDIK